MHCKVTWSLHNLRWRIYTLFQRMKELQTEFMYHTKLKWIYNLTGQECTHGTVMYCYAVALGVFMIWLPRFDSHGAEQSSHFSITQELVWNWCRAAVLPLEGAHSWCRLECASCNGTAGLSPATPQQASAAPTQHKLNNFPTHRFSHSWYQTDKISLIFLHSQWLWDSGRNKESLWKKTEMFLWPRRRGHSRVSLASLPEELLMSSAQHLYIHQAAENTSDREAEGSQGNSPYKFMETSMERAELTCPGTLRAVALAKCSPPPENPNKRDSWYTPQPPQCLCTQNKSIGIVWIGTPTM